MEFKRKYPAQGWWEDAADPSFSRHLDAAYLLGQLYRDQLDQARNVAQHCALVARWGGEISVCLSRRNVWTRFEKPCFGLDLSHVRIVQDSEIRGAIFTHVIWNNQETEIENLLDAALVPREEVSLVAFDLKRESFSGIPVTPGSKASAFHGNPRVQLAFSESHGDPVPDLAD